MAHSVSAGSQPIKWSRTFYLLEGQTAATDNENLVVTLKEVSGKVASIDIQAVVDCCVKKWQDVIAVVDDNASPSWSEIQTCICADGAFYSTVYHQVRAAISYNG
jgi:hypothetical protein